jgi:hypothetical protein
MLVYWVRNIHTIKKNKEALSDASMEVDLGSCTVTRMQAKIMNKDANKSQDLRFSSH